MIELTTELVSVVAVIRGKNKGYIRGGFATDKKERGMNMELMDATAEENKELQKELVRLAKKSRFKKKLISGVAVILVVLIAVTVSWLSGRSRANKKAQAEIAELKNELEMWKDSPFIVDPVSPKINLDIIHSEIKSIAELATFEYMFTDAAEFSDSKQIKNWNIPFTEKSFILRWSGEIKAGVDLEQVNIEVDETEKTILVTLPAAKILSYSIDSDSVDVLYEKDNIINNISVSDKVKFDAKTEDAMKKRAIENGLLEKAQKNAEDILARLIQSDPAVGRNYTIEFVVKQ